MSPIDSKSIKQIKPKPKRNRVPVSCLSCKKRKVKCDKGKPSCGGCIRNGVGHLCQYIDPPWLDKDLTSNITTTTTTNGNYCSNMSSPISIVTQQQPIIIEQTDEYKSLKQSNETIIKNQRKEIEDLKRQLSVIQQLTPKENHPNGITTQSPFKSITTSKITILNKLNPLPFNNKDKLEIINDCFKILSQSISNQFSKQTYIDLYSWINLIKLDPQLTTLWFKITNLQKIYHMYKMNILKDVNVNMNHNSKLNKKNFKINEIDFTYSFNSQTTPSPNQTPQPQPQSKCPVIECDFNFMVEEALSNSSNSNSPFRNLNELKNITTTTTKEDEQDIEKQTISESITTLKTNQISYLKL